MCNKQEVADAPPFPSPINPTVPTRVVAVLSRELSPQVSDRISSLEENIEQALKIDGARFLETVRICIFLGKGSLRW